MFNYYGYVISDVGISKKTNQDSACLKIADTEKYGQVVLAMICDGMGGLSKGELASATAIRRFSFWFENELPKVIDTYSWKELSNFWDKSVKELNYKIMSYGTQNQSKMGTTITAMLIIEGKYLITHIGDTRVYKIRDAMEQLTEDQTYVAREIKRGNMTIEQAKTDPRRNMLLQCVGASKIVEPQIINGSISAGDIYLLCSDGFRHVINENEIFNSFNPQKINSLQDMSNSISYMIETVKSRNERDNITALLLKCE